MDVSMRALAVTAAIAASGAIAQPKDAPNCSDSPLVTRFPGARIVSCKTAAFKAMKMPLAKGSRAVEGEFSETQYSIQPARDAVEVKRNFSNALKAAGFSIDYEDTSRNVVAHKDNLWIWESTSSNTYTQTIVREQAMRQEVVANADALAKGLAAEGHMVANGILFDTGAAQLKPESKAALDEIAKLLAREPALKVYVVGHTDNQGSLVANMELSKQRAAAVVKALEAQYGVAPARMASFGDGPYAPVASNDNEDGRARNRRVELVKQ